MFENLMLNLRNIGNTILHYSWVIGILVGLFMLAILSPGEIITYKDIFLVTFIMIIVWIKWAIIGFAIRTFANLFLVKPEENQRIKNGIL